MAEAATVVTVFHRALDRAAFVDWWARVDATARSKPGFANAQIAAPEPVELDWAVSATFDSEDELHLWLDGADRPRLLAEGESLGFRRMSADLILVEGSLPPPGIGIFEHSVAPGKEQDFEETQELLVALSSSFSGYEGAILLRSGAESGQWLSVLRFRTDHQLSEWMKSKSRAHALPELRSTLTEDFSVIRRSTPFGSILRVEDGKTRITPDWKSAMLVLLVLYPTVMTLSRFLGPVLNDLGTQPWLSMWLSQIASVGLMTWLFMPAITAWFRRWLDPVDGAGLRISLIGAGVAVLTYVATLVLFGSVKWLQYWDYMD